MRPQHRLIVMPRIAQVDEEAAERETDDALR
jgi:hypothetical protein